MFLVEIAATSKSANFVLCVCVTQPAEAAAV